MKTQQRVVPPVYKPVLGHVTSWGYRRTEYQYTEWLPEPPKRGSELHEVICGICKERFNVRMYSARIRWIARLLLGYKFSWLLWAVAWFFLTVGSGLAIKPLRDFTWCLVMVLLIAVAIVLERIYGKGGQGITWKAPNRKVGHRHGIFYAERRP